MRYAFHDPDCRCWRCEYKDQLFGFATEVERFDEYRDYARDVVRAAPALDRAIEQARYAIETARQPTACGMESSCQAVKATLPSNGMRYACFGCPNRRVETTFLERKDW